MTIKIKTGPVWYYAGYLFGPDEWKVGELRYEDEQPLLYLPGQPTPVLLGEDNMQLLKSLKAVTQPKQLKNGIPF